MSKPTFNKFKKTDHEIYKTVCSVCHKPCEVPFKPNGKKPVFCDTCFGKTKETARPTFTKQKDKTVFEIPTDVVLPTYTGQTSSSTDLRLTELKRELHGIQAKLDKLINLFEKLK